MLRFAFFLSSLFSPFTPFSSPPPHSLFFFFSSSIVRLLIAFHRYLRGTYMLVALVAVPFGDGQHFVQLAGGTNDRTAPKLLELGLIGNRQQASSVYRSCLLLLQIHQWQHVFPDESCTTSITTHLSVELLDLRLTLILRE